MPVDYDKLKALKAPLDEEKESTEWKLAVKQCESLLAELADLPERAENFVASAEETVLSIQEWIEEHQHVTPAQTKALYNILSGASKWRR